MFNKIGYEFCLMNLASVALREMVNWLTEPPIAKRQATVCAGNSPSVTISTANVSNYTSSSSLQGQSMN